MKLSTGLEILSIPDYSTRLDGTQKVRWRAWIEALRSGKYQQARKRLRTDVGFCCLGVICEMAVAEGFSHWGDGVDAGTFFSGLNESGACTELPDSTAVLYGLPMGAGFRVDVDACHKFCFASHTPRPCLAELNDGEAATFEDIALILETALAGGFNPALGKDRDWAED
jgi:hypothetical protein